MSNWAYDHRRFWKSLKDFDIFLIHIHCMPWKLPCVPVILDHVRISIMSIEKVPRLPSFAYSNACNTGSQTRVAQWIFHNAVEWELAGAYHLNRAQLAPPRIPKRPHQIDMKRPVDVAATVGENKDGLQHRSVRWGSLAASVRPSMCHIVTIKNLIDFSAVVKTLASPASMFPFLILKNVE